MGRPRSNHLPRRVTVRRLPTGGNLYYYQRDGAKLPLGSSERDAIDKAAKLERCAISPDEAKLGHIGFVTEADVLRQAVPIRPQPGIYFLLSGKRVVYVGRSINVWGRIQQHLTSRRAFDAFSWVPCEPARLKELERHFIVKFRPIQNIIGMAI